MPIIKSAKKQLRQNRKRRAKNLGVSNMMKNHIKDLEKTLEKDVKEAALKLPKVQKLIDSAAKKRVISENRASRLISRLTLRVNKAGK